MKIQPKASNNKNCSSILSHTQPLSYFVLDVLKTYGDGPGLAKTQPLQATLFSKTLLSREKNRKGNLWGAKVQNVSLKKVFNMTLLDPIIDPIMKEL